MLYPVESLFIFMVIFGTFFSVSSSSWVGIWLGMELNLFGLMPIFTLRKYTGEVESAVIYFLAQSVGSLWVLFGVLLSFSGNYIYEWVIFIGASIKFGLGVFYFWLPKVMVGLMWFNCIILSTWQKILPLFIYFLFINVGWAGMFLCGVSAIIGGLGGLNQSSFRSLMAFSSIGHMGWFVSVMFFGWLYSLLYFLIYSCLSGLIFFIVKLSSYELMYIIDFGFSSFTLGQFFVILSLAGIPPFLGFMSKLMSVIIISSFILFLSILLLGSFFSLYYYLIFSFSLCSIDFWSWVGFKLIFMMNWFIMFFLINFFGWITMFLFFILYALVFFYES